MLKIGDIVTIVGVPAGAEDMNIVRDVGIVGRIRDGQYRVDTKRGERGYYFGSESLRKPTRDEVERKSREFFSLTA